MSSLSAACRALTQRPISHRRLSTVAKSGNRLAREKGRPDKARFKAELDTPDTTLIFCKPYRVLSAFTSRDVDDEDVVDQRPQETLKAYFQGTNHIYPAGRLDYRSEGLLILTNNSHLATSVTQTALPKRYWVLVEGKVTDDIITSLRSGLDIGNGEKTLPCVVNHLPGPPPLIDELFPVPQALVGRVYDGSNHSWLEFELREGKNRQIRRMVAKVGLGAIRIVRHAIGALSLENLRLRSGQHKEMDMDDLRIFWDSVLQSKKYKHKASV